MPISASMRSSRALSRRRVRASDTRRPILRKTTNGQLSGSDRGLEVSMLVVWDIVDLLMDATGVAVFNSLDLPQK